MVSDKFLIKAGSLDKPLDKIERFAACYDFSTKEVNKIRLLAEEIISIISPTLALSDGRFWITTTEISFAVTIDCDAGINGLDQDTKSELMQISRSEEKKGVFGMIDKVFEYLSSPEVDYSMMAGQQLFYSQGIDSGICTYYWNPRFDSYLPQVSTSSAPVGKPSQKEDHNLEINIIEGYADDIRVFLQKGGKTGGRLEITVVKIFKMDQVNEIQI